MFQMFQVLESMCIHQLYLFPPNPGFAHTQTTHPNNMTYSSPEDELKHWLYAVILTLSFSGFRVLIYGLGF